MSDKMFTEVLELLRNGETENELNIALVDLVDAVQETTKSGTLTLSLTIKPQGGGRVVVVDKITTKIPALSKQPTMFFATEGNELVRNNPRQGTIHAALKDLEPKEPLPLKKVESMSNHADLKAVEPKQATN